MRPDEWFPPLDADGISGLFKNSSVTTFVDAEEYFADLRAETEATGASGQICWIGFETDVAVQMPKAAPNHAKKPFTDRGVEDGDTTWWDLLEAADKRGVAMRALLNLHPSPKDPVRYREFNLRVVQKLNTLKHAAAINDFRYLFVNGTHHQKMVLVHNDKGLFAYCGTCDVQPKRINERWCEVHLKISGDAAIDLYKVFSDRWNEFSSVFEDMGLKSTSLIPLSRLRNAAVRSGNLLTQFSTTYGNPTRFNPFWPWARALDTPFSQVVNRPHRLTWGLGPLSYTIGNDFFKEKDPAAPALIKAAKKLPSTYSFASKGHTGIYRVLERAIEKTEKFIYLEDQYLVCDRDMRGRSGMPAMPAMLKLLEKKVAQPGFRKLIVLCTRVDDINEDFEGTAWAHRRPFLEKLVAAGKDRVVICQYKRRDVVKAPLRPEAGLFYIHSKTWVFDDQYLVTGSANCNRRGYSHDSELNFGMVDTTGNSVRDLRVRLWKSRLNTEGISGAPLKDVELVDFEGAARYWENPKAHGLTIESHRNTSLAPTAHPDLDFASFKARVTKQSGIEPRAAGIIDNLKGDALWDYAVDPDGT